MFSVETCRSKQKYLLLGGVRFSACAMLTGFTAHNKSNCKVSIWNRLALHIAQRTACKDIENSNIENYRKQQYRKI